MKVDKFRRYSNEFLIYCTRDLHQVFNKLSKQELDLPPLNLTSGTFFHFPKTSQTVLNNSAESDPIIKARPRWVARGVFDGKSL